ncbi:MAG: hypothetical protein ACLTK8_03060 [Paeniclostridium sp.]
MPLGMYLDDQEFERVRTFRKNVRNEKITFEEYDNSTILQTIYWLEQNQMFLWLAVDITKDERAKEKLQTLKIETVEMAQQVIAKQMTVAQVQVYLVKQLPKQKTLTKLKNFILDDEEGKE